MREKTTSGALRWLAAIGLAASAVPIGLAWHNAALQNSLPQPALAAEADSAWVNPGTWTVPGEIAVQLRPGTSNDALTDLGRKLGSPLSWDSAEAETEGVADVTLPSGISADAALTMLRSDPRVEAADTIHYYGIPQDEVAQTAAEPMDNPEPDRGKWKPNDPRYGEQWNFQMIKAEDAWPITKGKGAIVAVIDTGVAYGDSKKGKRARDFGETKFVKGYDFCGRDDIPYDDNGHGTHVAGTIAESTDNNEGVAGLAFESTIMPLKVLTGQGFGRSSDIAEAIRWAADHGANVINMSLGGPYPDSLMASACEYAKKKGVTIVCAAGNSGREGVGYPAAYKDCVAVSSVGPKGKLSFYSSWGKQVAIAAPGGDKQVGGDAGGILQNTVMRDENGVQDDYFSFQGTSMASPHVAAVAALIVSQGVKDPNEVKSVLQKSAQKVDGPKEKYGAGILDAAAAAKVAGNVYGDGVARFWIVAVLFLGCFAVGKMRRKSGAGYPFWGTMALAFGMLFPDWLTGFLGATSQLNLVGHSILIPGALLVMGAEGKTERRLIGWMAFGLALHLGWEFLRGTSPFGPEIGTWQLLPWVASNVFIGLAILLSGLTARRD